MFVVSFANLKSRALSRDPSGNCMMLSAEVPVRVQASHGIITFLSHFKSGMRDFEVEGLEVRN